MEQIKARNCKGVEIHVYIDKNPDHCPICHHGIGSQRTATVALTSESVGSGDIEVAFRCPRSACSRLFIGRYRNPDPRRSDHYYLRHSVPAEIAPPPVPKEVSEVSPAFAAIYRQADAAETYALNEIAGVGYRKALEFLIKDYCISLNQTAAEAIKNEFLGATIANRVADANLKACAKRAAWLGNDETHYVRRWEEKDISDLKALLELAMGWIRSDVLTQKYLKDMPEEGR